MKTSLDTRHRTAQRGFTLMEVIVASNITFVAFSIIGFAMIGLQETARTSMTQIANRYNSTNAVKKIGRVVMQATRVEIEEDEGGQGMVHIWRDDQVEWTPETTDDDTEGLLYFNVLNREIRYRENIDDPLSEEVLGSNLEEVEFSLVGEAVFLELTLDYDVDDRWHDEEDERTKRTVYSSFAVRNNPRVRIGATQ